MSLLEITGLTVALPPGGDRPNAVSDISLTLEAGEILCIVGESGSGKSVSTAAVTGLLPKQLPVRSGRILFEGRDLLALKPEEMRALRGARIGMIFQEPMTALNPLMRVADQIAEVLQVHGVHPGNRVTELIAAVGLPDPARIARSYPHQLSGGQRQRVMIAMALALEPAMLVADEPTTALDVTTQMQILRLIRSIQRRRGMGVIFITHDFGVVAEIADRVAVMQHGRIVETGAAQEVLNAPAHPYTRALIRAVPRFEGRAPDGAAVGSDVLVAARDIRKTYRSHGLFRRPATKAIDGATIEIRRGETLGLVGESGSGKSTLARTLVRLVRPDDGRIVFDGADLRPLSRSGWLPYRKRIQMVFQDPFASLNPRRRVGEIITEGPIAHGVPRAQAEAEALELLDLVRLDRAAAGRYPHEFSGGQRQRIGIARALAMKPELLIADEPVSALDVSVQAQVLDLLRDLRRRLGLSMLFITHDLRVAAQICDRIAVMRRGEIVEQGETAAVFAAPTHDYTRELLDSIPGRHWTPPALAMEPAA
ncbi:ABC transporter ATP-binding protein [Inquilinus sp. Marseille-Q2685]|uniref:ABC transporter ATP-binding protein n=1 Tax=Inquilinus sp. Marseille-Q2685 TaxID=2866581 RepID=UPI001CE4B4F1|nr:ABC transporter ATP-binding protein [Inquilinus sp. Marseille-Q2685]